MTTIRQASAESIIDRDREHLVAKIVAGIANTQERARLEELSSARAALMKKPLSVHRAIKRARFAAKHAG